MTNDTYPGMIVSRQAAVDGVLYFDVDAQDVAALGAFEGSEYRRDPIALIVNSGGTVIACTYIFIAEKRLFGLPWEPQTFQTSRFMGSYGSDKLGS